MPDLGAPNQSARIANPGRLFRYRPEQAKNVLSLAQPDRRSNRVTIRLRTKTLTWRKDPDPFCVFEQVRHEQVEITVLSIGCGCLTQVVILRVGVEFEPAVTLAPIKVRDAPRKCS